MRVRTLLNPFNCLSIHEKKPLNELFQNFNGTLDIEMGLGSGSFLLHYGAHNPERFLIGFEIRKRLADLAQQKIVEAGLKHVQALWGNGEKNLKVMFDNESIDRIFIFHPDPWPKLRHQRRRIINQEFLELCWNKLKTGGKLYIATDVPELWDYMSLQIDQSQKFKPYDDDFFWQTFYKTRWKEMSESKQREVFYQAYEK